MTRTRKETLYVTSVDWKEILFFFSTWRREEKKDCLRHLWIQSLRQKRLEKSQTKCSQCWKGKIFLECQPCHSPVMVFCYCRATYPGFSQCSIWIVLVFLSPTITLNIYGARMEKWIMWTSIHEQNQCIPNSYAPQILRIMFFQI